MLSKAEKELYYFQMAGGTSFSVILYKLIAKADWNNIEKLRLAFPEEVAVWERYQNEDGYWEDLCERMKG